MTMEDRAALVTVNLNRQAINVQGQLIRAFALLQRGQTPYH